MAGTSDGRQASDTRTAGIAMKVFSHKRSSTVKTGLGGSRSNVATAAPDMRSSANLGHNQTRAGSKGAVCGRQ